MHLFIATQTSSSSCQKYSELWIGLQYRFTFNAIPFLLLAFFFQADPNLKKQQLFSKISQFITFKGSKEQNSNLKRQNKPLTTTFNFH